MSLGRSGTSSSSGGRALAGIETGGVALGGPGRCCQFSHGDAPLAAYSIKARTNSPRQVLMVGKLSLVCSQVLLPLAMGGAKYSQAGAGRAAEAVAMEGTRQTT